MVCQFLIPGIYGEGSQDHAAVAYLVPVVFSAEPAVECSVAGRKQAFFHDGIFYRLSVLLIKPAVKPVITDSHGKGHFGRIQKMPWIPVLKSGDIEHFLYTSFCIPFITCNPVCIAAEKDSSQTFSGNTQQFPFLACQDSAAYRFVEQLFSGSHK